MSFFKKLLGKMPDHGAPQSNKESAEEIVMRRARSLITVEDRTSQLGNLSDHELDEYGKQVWQNKVRILRLNDSLRQQGRLSPDEAMMQHAATKALNRLESYWMDAQRQLEKRGRNFYF